jgi:hypothetical protein
MMPASSSRWTRSRTAGADMPIRRAIAEMLMRGSSRRSRSSFTLRASSRRSAI